MIFSTKRISAFLLLYVFTGTALFAQTDQEKISDDELNKFASIFQQIRMMNQQVQQQMAEVVENEKMEIQRFNEIHKATLDPAVEVTLTEGEKEQYDKIVSRIEEIQLDFQNTMKDMITDAGMTVERYKQIATRLQTDEELQERFRDTFEN